MKIKIGRCIASYIKLVVYHPSICCARNLNEIGYSSSVAPHPPTVQDTRTTGGAAKIRIFRHKIPRAYCVLLHRTIITKET